jgi:3-oxoacyl-[acyl-carrier protein] reductase
MTASAGSFVELAATFQGEEGLSRLDGKVALVTGGSRVIDRAICASLAREGASVVVNYRSDDDAAGETLKGLSRHGGEHALVRADIGS